MRQVWVMGIRVLEFSLASDWLVWRDADAVVGEDCAHVVILFHKTLQEGGCVCVLEMFIRQYCDINLRNINLLLLVEQYTFNIMLNK